MLPKSIVALTFLSLALVAAPPSLASAAPGEYAVRVCTQSSPTGGGTAVRNPDGTYTGSGLVYEGDQDASHFVLVPCDVNGHIDIHSPHAASIPDESFRFVTLVAAVDTRIKEMTFSAPLTRFADLNFHSFLQWVVRRAGFIELLDVVPFRDDRLVFAENGSPSGRFQIENRVASAGLLCAGRPRCDGGGEMGAIIEGLSANVVDEFLPGVAGPDLATRTLRGTTDVGFKAADRGSGIAKVEMLVDGKALASKADDNDGKCTAPPYKFMEPCKLEIESSFSLDTTKLADGPHNIAILATDASGLTRETPPLTVLVHNAPANLARPEILGPATVGAKLMATPGEWAGAPTGIAYRWFRCPVFVKGDEGVEACRGIPGATNAQYTTSKDDLGQRDLVEVKASNASGSESRLSFPTDAIEEPRPETHPGAAKPVLTHLSLSRKRFRVGPTLSKKGKRGAVLAFTCNKAGEVSIAIRRPRRHGKPKSLGKLVATVKSGRSRILLSGEIGKRRRLKPGRYEAVVRVTDPKGTASDPASVRFTIIPG